MEKGIYIRIEIENKTEEINALTIAKMLASHKYDTLELVEFIDGGVWQVENEYTQAKRKYYEELEKKLGIEGENVPKDLVVVDVVDDWETNRLIFRRRV